MIRRRIGYAAWLLLAVCLYFFENNTGTRVVLFCSALLPFIPPLRSAFFPPQEAEVKKAPVRLTVRTFARQDPEDPGDIRPYVPGDPIRRIHWKLSAKKDELLVRSISARQSLPEPILPQPSEAMPVTDAASPRRLSCLQISALPAILQSQQIL